MIKVQISDLKSNNRKASRTIAQIEYVRNMVKDGSIPAILIDSQYNVIDGNHRIAACKELGVTEIYAKVI